MSEEAKGNVESLMNDGPITPAAEEVIDQPAEDTSVKDEISNIWSTEEPPEKEVKEEPKKEEESKDEKKDEEPAEDSKVDDKVDEKEDDKPVEDSELLKKARAKVQAQKEAEEKAEQKANLESEKDFTEEDFSKSMDLAFPDFEVDIEGEKKKLSEIASEMPDVAALVKAAVAQAVKSNSIEINKINQEIDRDYFVRAVEKKHPNASELSQKPEFLDWLKEQDDSFKTLYGSSEVADVVLVFDHWKKENAPKPKEEPKVDKVQKAREDVLSREGGSKSAKIPKKESAGMLTDDLRKKIWGE